MTKSAGIFSVATEIGGFQIALRLDAAPNTCQYFIDHVSQRFLDGTSIFRIVAPVNQDETIEHPIMVLQWGFTPDNPSPITPIAVETTKESGLAHRKWTISTARFGENESYGSFFVCLRDEPELDFGGHRQPDGKGFAAFGEVVDGFSILEAAFNQAESDEMLSKPIYIFSVMPQSVA